MPVARDYSKENTVLKPAYRPGWNTGQNTLSSAGHANTSSLTELVFTRHSSDSSELMLPMLCFLSRIRDRWITWFTTSRLDRSLLQHHGVNTAGIRVIYVREGKDIRWMVEKALGNRTSHTVVASFDDINEQDIQHFEAAARLGQSKGLLIRYR